MQPGSGKTYIVFLLMKFMAAVKNSTHSKLIYVVPTRWLQSTAKEIALDFDFKNPPLIILPSEMDNYQDDDILWIVEGFVRAVEASRGGVGGRADANVARVRARGDTE